MKTELELFKFYKEKEQENYFQVVGKKIPYIVCGEMYGKIGSFLIYEEELQEREFEKITKQRFLKNLKVSSYLIQNTIALIEETSEEEYEEKRQIWFENFKESITPFEGIRILLNPEKIKDEKTIDWICQGENEKDKENIKNIFEEFSKSRAKMIEKTIILTDKKVINLLYIDNKIG